MLFLALLIHVPYLCQAKVTVATYKDMIAFQQLQSNFTRELEETQADPLSSQHCATFLEYSQKFSHKRWSYQDASNGRHAIECTQGLAKAYELNNNCFDKVATAIAGPCACGVVFGRDILPGAQIKHFLNVTLDYYEKNSDIRFEIVANLRTPRLMGFTVNCFNTATEHTSKALSDWYNGQWGDRSDDQGCGDGSRREITDGH